jgi:coenzyme F420-reducing hydrogenase delta subunit
MQITSSCETEPLEIVVLYCQHSVCGGVPADESAKDCVGCTVRHVMLPCSSKAMVWHLLKLLESGVDGVEVVVCPEGACRHLEGSRRTRRRVDYVRRLLAQLGISAERLGIREASGLSAGALPEIAAERATALEAGRLDIVQTGGER